VRLVVMASGQGSNLGALIEAIQAETLAAEILAVVSDQPEAYALTRAHSANIPAYPLPKNPGESRQEYDRRLAELVRNIQPDLVILAGWMRLLSMNFLSHFPHQVLNIHPALPGELPGVNAIERAWDEHLAGQRTHSGVMVHLVPNEGVDDGPVIATTEVPISSGDDLPTFQARMHAAEHRLLRTAIALYHYHYRYQSGSRS
jgi:phosphoribosylglycinamide formyltransferase-1